MAGRGSRVAANQSEVVLAGASGRVPGLVEDPRRGDHRGAAVESEAFDFTDIGAAAQFVLLLEQFDLMAAGCQSHCSAQTAESGADDDDFRQENSPGVGLALPLIKRSMDPT